jgi:pimeloyl-ACP methyl ester carboxylesterase
LADRLASVHTVISVDRRGSGESQLPEGRRLVPIEVDVHVADLLAIIEHEGLDTPVVAGHSYGGCLALELAARHPQAVSGLWAYEPPYFPVASPASQAAMADIGRRTLEAYDEDGPEAAAEAFVAGVSGEDAVAALTPLARRRIGGAGPGAVADATLSGMDPAHLEDIDCPVTIATGTDSHPVYVEIAVGLSERIRSAHIERLKGMGHMAPIVRPDVIAASIEAIADR